MSSNYTDADADASMPGHLVLVGTPLEVVAYRQGDDLMLLVNKGGVCVYREQLANVLAENFAASEFLVDERHQAHAHGRLMREFIDHHPVSPLRRWINRMLR